MSILILIEGCFRLIKGNSREIALSDLEVKVHVEAEDKTFASNKMICTIKRYSRLSQQINQELDLSNHEIVLSPK